MFRPLVPSDAPNSKNLNNSKHCGTHAFAGLLGLILCIAALSAPSTGSAATADTANNTSFPGGVYQWTPPENAEQIRFRNKPVMQIGNTVLLGLPVSQPLGEVSVSYTGEQSATNS